MAWTTPRTWVTSELETASIFNTHVRDNLRALEPFFLKTTAKAATNTVSETDLFNSECAITASRVGTTGGIFIRAQGDWVATSGAGQAPPRFRFKWGSGPTTVFDTSTFGAGIPSSATRWNWFAEIEIEAQGATNVQWITFRLQFTTSGASSGSVAFATGAGEYALLTTSALAIGGAAGAIDTTAAQTLQLTVVNGSATTTETKLQTARGWYTA